MKVRHKGDYRARRRAAYPPIEDFVDAVVKGDTEALERYIAQCREVKERYPKPPQDQEHARDK